MSTVASRVDSPPSRNAATVTGRFAWKEYRSLRALWLAVLVLGVFIQWVAGQTLRSDIDFATIYFSIALAAAALYAAGAAATTFAVEHEDETFNFLSGLPTTWLPVFTGKLAFATTSAIALAAMLCIAGCLATNFDTPGRHDGPGILMIFGFAIVEALAWGTLFSLLVKRPLLAAILALVVGIVVLQICVSAWSPNAAALSDPDAYIHALPLRIGVVVCVLFAAIMAARRWLTTATTTPTKSGSVRWTEHLARLKPLKSAAATLRSPNAFPAHRAQFARLLWQSWRQSWKWLLAPIPVALFLAIGFGTIGGLLGRHLSWFIVAPIAAGTAFLLPGLYGALAFNADQRRRQYRFLAERAARPRYVWLSRQIVWGGTLIVVATTVAFLLAFWIASIAYEELAAYVGNYEWRIAAPEAAAHYLKYNFDSLSYVVFAIQPIACGIALAYAIGQFFSMLVRSEILAAFLTCVAAFFISTWCLLMYGWSLAAWWTVIPIAIGLLAATWLRAPGWITERNTWRAWLAPATAVVFGVALPFLFIPGARVAQVQRRIDAQFPDHEIQTTLTTVGEAYRAGDTPAARKTADMYLRVPSLLSAPWGDQSPIAPWNMREFQLEFAPGQFGGIDDNKILVDQRDEYWAAMKKAAELERQARAEATEVFLAATRRPTCRFDFEGHYIGRWAIWHLFQYGVAGYFDGGRGGGEQSYFRLTQFMREMADDIGGPEALDRFMALLRASQHIRSAQPTSVYSDQLLFESLVLEKLADWAMRGEKTDDQLREITERLQGHFTSTTKSAQSIYAVRRQVRQVISRGDVPMAFDQAADEGHDRFGIYLAMLLTDYFPWERTRADLALDLDSVADMQQVDVLARFAMAPGDPNPRMPADKLRSYIRTQIDRAWQGNLPQPFEPLGELEFNARNNFGMLIASMATLETHRRGVLIQLALTRYRRDHGRYPAELANLAPKYLDAVPLDPYTDEPFYYEPDGLDLPLINPDRGYAPNPVVPAQTPFFWSVGPCNVTLVTPRVEPDLEADPEEIEFGANEFGVPASKRKTIGYTLQSKNPTSWTNNCFDSGVFPLQPLPPEDSP